MTIISSPSEFFFVFAVVFVLGVLWSETVTDRRRRREGRSAPWTTPEEPV